MVLPGLRRDASGLSIAAFGSNWAFEMVDRRAIGVPIGVDLLLARRPVGFATPVLHRTPSRPDIVAQRLGQCEPVRPADELAALERRAAASDWASGGTFACHASPAIGSIRTPSGGSQTVRVSLGRTAQVTSQTIQQ